MKKYYSIVITIIVISLGLFLVQAKWCTANTFWHTAIGNIASAILICGIISLLEHIIIKKIDDAKLANLFKLSSSVVESGLSEILTNSQDYHYHNLIVSSYEFSGILNDGRRWIGNHSDALEERFNKKGFSTEFYFVNPDSDFCKALAQKTDLPGQDTPDVKIKQSISMLKSTYYRSSRQGLLHIYYLKNYPTQTLFYTENTIVVTPYQTSSGRATIPLYEYHYKKDKPSIGTHLYDDLQRVRDESTIVFDSTVEVQDK